MGALLGEPFLLASYPTTTQSFPRSGEESKGNSSCYASVTYSGSERGEGLATISVQGDGIHLLELSSLHATISHTLGPSTFFAAPAVTRFDSSDSSISYAVIHSAADGIKDHDCGRTIWIWRDYHSKHPEELSEPKRSVVFPKPIERIYAPSELPSHIIAISPSGDVMLSDAELNIVATNLADPNSTLVRSWIFKAEDCSFLLHRTHKSPSVVVMCFLSRGSELKTRIILAATSELELIAECNLKVEKNIIDVSCDPSGYTTVLCQGGRWHLFRFVHDSVDSIAVKSVDKSLHLTGFAFPTSKKGSNRSMCCPSIISVGSSFVLLSGISTGSPPELILLLWDIQYSVVLSSQRVALPLTLSYNPKMPPSLELVSASKSQALLVLSPSADSKSKKNRSTVLIVPLALPLTSTIALAMGKARESQKWLQVQCTHKPSGAEQGGRRLIETIEQAMADDRAEAADQAFFAWLERDAAQLSQKAGASPDELAENKNNEARGEVEAEPKALKKSIHKKNKPKENPKAHLSHQFVSNILHAVLQPSKPTASYSPKIVQYLISQEAVGHSMVEGGLFAALRQREDWNSIASALQMVHDLPENDVLQLLANIVKLHRRTHQSNDDEMLVDTSSGAPSLSHYLAMIVTYPMTAPMVRIALKTHFSDVRDINCILEVLEGWLSSWSRINTGITTFLDIIADSESSGQPGNEERPPSLQRIIIFLQSVLDAHFLTLLQYTPSHAIMVHISQHLDGQLASIEALNCLRAPLEAFVRVETQKGRIRSTEMQSDRDAWKRRREAAEAAELAIGLYQIEELMI